MNRSIKSEIFTAAHAMTRAVIRKGDDYRATFGLCLSYVGRLYRAAADEFSDVESVRLWEAGDRRRLYVNYHSINAHRGGADFFDLARGGWCGHQPQGRNKRIVAAARRSLGIAA